jgi:hypothetical protein
MSVLGPKGELSALNFDFRFTPNNGHFQTDAVWSFRVISGHSSQSRANLLALL